MDKFSPYYVQARPKTIPLFTFVQFVDDNRRHTDEVGIQYVDWGTWKFSQPVRLPVSITDLIMPAQFKKSPLTFTFGTMTFTEKTHSADHPFVKSLKEYGKWRRNATSIPPALTSVGVKENMSLRRFDATQNAEPFMTVGWNEQSALIAEMHIVSALSAQASLLAYQLTGSFNSYQPSLFWRKNLNTHDE